jgi:dTDP-4-dehydrorhamnose 3,5-epimerase
MKITETPFAGLLILEPVVLSDRRGIFFESLNKRTFKQLGLPSEFVQENQSRSKRGVIRGLHFQKDPFAQAKLVSALSGEVLDVVVDLRHDQPTYKQHYSIVLSSDNLKRLLVPRGFAHGLSVLSDSADILYHCDQFYHPESESGILWNDPQLAIDWKTPEASRIVSDKDLKLPRLQDLAYSFAT